MNAMYGPSLLRRTAAAIAAVAAFLIADIAAAQSSSITLSGVQGNTCNYTSMTVAPNGVFTVNCANATPPTPGASGIFSLSAAILNLGTGTSSTATNQLVVIRSAGTTDTIRVDYTIASAGGSCTAVAAGQLTFNAGSSAALALPVTATATLGTCTVTLTGVSTVGTPTTDATAPTLSSVAAQLVATVNVAAAPPPNTCPTPPLDLVIADLGPAGAVIKPSLSSGRIVSFPLPTLPTDKASGKIKIGETPTTPSAILEFTISKCPGIIDTTPSACYRRTSISNYNEMVWWYRPAPPRNEAWIIANGACWAPTAAGPYYLNARWTYTFSPYGTGAYAFQWGNGSY